MIPGRGQKVGGLLLGGWWFPEEAGNGVGVRGFRNLREFKAVLRCARNENIGGRWHQLRVEDLNLITHQVSLATTAPVGVLTKLCPSSK